MANMTIRDPFAGFLPLNTAMNRLLESSFVGPRDSGWPAQFPMDVCETEHEFVVRACLPGFRPEDVSISALGKQLSIDGKPAGSELPQGARYLVQEITPA